LLDKKVSSGINSMLSAVEKENRHFDIYSESGFQCKLEFVACKAVKLWIEPGKSVMHDQS
jgi:hypothetical protein